MRDGFDREISYLRLSVTERCNLRCRYCMPACGVAKRGHDDILSFEEIWEIVFAAAKLGCARCVSLAASRWCGRDCRSCAAGSPIFPA